MLRPLFVLAALLLLAAPVAAAENSALWAEADTVHADEDMNWTADLWIRNGVRVGLYPDSLFLDTEDLDAGNTRLPRHSTQSLAALVRTMQPLSAEDSAAFTYTAGTGPEHARLTFRLYLHDALGVQHAVSHTVFLDGGALTQAYPSSFVTAANKRRVEIVAATPLNAAAAPAPGILWVHGDGAHARRQLRNIKQLIGHGYGVVAVSQPGFGQSEGPADLAGPATLGALEAGLAALKHLPGVDPKRIAVWGVGRGATAALLLGARHPELSAVVAQAASYDPWATYRAASPELKAAMVAEAGPDSAAWRARAPLMQVALLKCPVLVLHAEQDATAPAGAAHAFAAAMLRRHATLETRFVSGNGPLLNRTDQTRLTLDYLSRRFGP